MKSTNSFFLIAIIIVIGCSPKVTLSEPENLYEISIEEAQSKMLNKRLTSLELTNYYLERIKKYDGDINAIITINPDAIARAEQMDRERSNGKIRSPLHGIPILIKDNIDTKDKMPNTAGSIHFAHNFPKQDAYIIEKLREAGAVILGKTNLSEWANFRSSKSISGWSSLGGQTRNPYNLLKTPCGSSAGTGAAIASDFATIGIGTETDGSIMCPSSVNGVVGLKPTVGLWSRSGIIPISKTQDTPGPMAKCVKDAAILLGLLSGIDGRDDATTNEVIAENDYAKYCTLGNMRGKRIGIDTSFINLKTPLGDQFRKAIEVMKSKGVVVVETNQRSLTSSTRSNEYELMLYEFKDGLNAYIKNNNLPEQSLENLIKLNKELADKAMPLFGQEIFEEAQLKGSLEEEKYKNAIKTSTIRCRYLVDSIMMANKLDAIVGPTLGQAWDIDPKTSKGFNGPSSYGIAAISGYPSITVPMGFIDHLPVGICFISGKNMERKIIGLAYEYEQTSRERKPPLLSK